MNAHGLWREGKCQTPALGMLGMVDHNQVYNDQELDDDDEAERNE